MAMQPSYPLHLNLDQLNQLKTVLDAAAASEADPDAPIFVLLDQVRTLRKQALNASQAGAENPQAREAAQIEVDAATRRN